MTWTVTLQDVVLILGLLSQAVISWFTVRQHTTMLKEHKQLIDELMEFKATTEQRSEEIYRRLDRAEYRGYSGGSRSPRS